MKKASQGRVVPAIPLPLTKKNATGARPTSSPATPIDSSAASAKGRSEDGGGEHQTAVLAASNPTREPGIAPASTQVVAEEESKGGLQPSPNKPGGSPHPLTNGTTPDRQPNAISHALPAAVAATTNGMTDNFSPPASAGSGSGSGSVRKPSDRFDMRHIRTELPPAFVPSAEQHTPQSATPSQSRQQPPVLPHAHPSHPGVSKIQFGSVDSATSSPAPPQNASSAFVPPQFPPHAPYYSHAHHASEPHPPRMYQPAYQQQPAPWAMRQAFAPGQAPYHPQARVPSRHPPREGQRQMSAELPNGHDSDSRTASQVAHTQRDRERKAQRQREVQSQVGLDQPSDSVSFTHPPPRQFPTHTPHGSQHFPHPDVAAGLDNAEAIRGHVITYFDSPDFADCQLEISEEDGANRQYLDGHRIVLARSSKLRDIIRQSGAEAAAAGSDKTQVKVTLFGRFVRGDALGEAIRYLYGGPLPPYVQYSLGPHASTEDRVELALRYIATGAWLNLTPFAHRGVEIATSLLQWDTITTVLAFAMSGGISQVWGYDDGNEERTSTTSCSSDDSLTKPEAGGQPAYDPFATALLTRTLDFMAHKYPPNFYLDASAPQSIACPRLPAQTPRHENRPSRSDPRLSKIRFGEHQAEDHSRPSFATTTVSSILLSLPFPLLKYLLEHPVLPDRLGAETVASIMRQVVNEREIRRRKTLKARAADTNIEEPESHLVQNLYWEESVEYSGQPAHSAGFRLARRRRGIATPPTGAGVEDEQRK